MKKALQVIVTLLGIVCLIGSTLSPVSAADKEAPRGKLDRSTISTCGEGNSVLKGRETLEGEKPSRLLKTRCKGTVELAVIASNPPNGAIDVREPSEPDGTGSYGWNTIELTFNASISWLSPADFVVESSGGEEPNVVNVTSAGANAVLELDRPIPAGERTTISHPASGSSICLGYLPGDVNGNGLVEAADIEALSACLTGGSSGTCEPWQTDINRSGSTTFADLLRVIDLYNGADAFEAWEGRTLPVTCPGEELRADFGVFELVHVDPVTGEEEWREIDLANEEVEYGLRVKLDGTLSAGATHFRWTLDGFGIPHHTEPVVFRTFVGPFVHELSLEVYDATAQQTDIITKTVRVGNGMVRLVSQNSDPLGNIAGSLALTVFPETSSEIVWVRKRDPLIPGLKPLYVFDVTAPEQMVYLGETEPLIENWNSYMASSENLLFIAGRYKIDIFEVREGHTIPSVTLINSIAFNPHEQNTANLQVVGKVLFVGLGKDIANINEGLEGLRLYDISNPSSPKNVGEIDFGSSPSRIEIAGHTVFVAEGGANLHGVDISQLDVQNPEPIELTEQWTYQDVDQIFYDEYDVSEDGQIIAAATPTWLKIFRVLPTGLQLLSTFNLYDLEPVAYWGPASVLISENRLYMPMFTTRVDYRQILVFDITNPQNIYITQRKQSLRGDDPLMVIKNKNYLVYSAPRLGIIIYRTQ